MCTNQNITSRPKCRSYKLFLQFRTPLDGNRCRFCRATIRTAWRCPADPLGHRRPTPDTRRFDTKPASSTFQSLVDFQLFPASSLLRVLLLFFSSIAPPTLLNGAKRARANHAQLSMVGMQLGLAGVKRSVGMQRAGD